MLGQLPIPEHDNLLVGTNTGDDASIWRISEDRALIATVDFITPIVDDANLWGQISASNAVSDIYAMGGEPLFALNIVGWNSEKLPSELLVDLLEGASNKAKEGGWIIVGGHTVEDNEPKYGMCVIGEVDPLRILRNTGLRPGDALILTKPLGIGIITTAIKSGSVDDSIQKMAIESMLKLNKKAKDIALRYGATGATDVTGFGLLGHLSKMLDQSGLDATLATKNIPLISGVRELAEAGSIPGGSIRNLEWVKPSIIANAQSDTDLLILADAQTSGGLLFGVEMPYAHDALANLLEDGLEAAIIGQVETGSGKILLE